MKIKHSELKAIIKEEIKAYYKELSDLKEANPYHDSKGHWTSKDKAETYSFTKGADVSDDLKQRGKVKGDKVIAKFGMNTGSKEKQCGKLDFTDGNKKPITLSCKDYNKPYFMKETEELLTEDDPDMIYIKKLVQTEIQKALKQLAQQRKEKGCRPTLDDFLRYQQALTAATTAPKKQ